MTFLEAAIEVLRSSEEPLHYVEIARLAVERKLLSHVGRDPEAAMQSCLNSAVRGKVHDGLVMRSKPGHYRLRPGVDVPDLPPAPSEAEPLPDVDETEVAKADSGKKSKKSKKKASVPSKKSSAARRRAAEPKAAKLEAVAEPEVAEPAEVAKAEDETAREVGEEREQDSDESVQTPVPMPHLDPSKVRFRGPEGSGLEGDTDVALVMANAMSRLVEERPELREELEAMQKGQAPVPEVIEVGRKKRLDEDRVRDRDRDEDRGGRRRRRRRRRGRRVEWSEPGGDRAVARGVELLDKVAAVLVEAGSRSLHVRQIAENLAAQNVLGGEISEIERAVTAAILLDVHRRGDASRFAVRGDARYQLRGSRLPEKAAAAEHAARAALLALESETEVQLLLWLQSLGARSLEAIVRIWLDREDYSLVATLPPSRGLGKLVVDDPEADDDDGRTLVLIVPRKTSLEPKLWDGEAERNGCSATLVFAMTEVAADSSSGPLAGSDARVIFAKDFARWLLRHGVGVRTLEVRVPVLDANLIESIAGLDT